MREAYKKFGDIPENKRTWRLFVDGVDMPFASAILVLDNPQKNMFRVVECGLVDDQRGNVYDGVRYGELGGGGVVTVPFTIFYGMLYIGVITQFRVHAGGDVRNVPRGYLKVGDTDRTKNAKDEFAEEVGPRAAALATPVQLEGEGANPNTAVFWTPETEDGVTFHAVRINSKYLELAVPGPLLVFPKGFVAPEGGESIVKCEFVPWTVAAQLRDGLTMMAVVRLLAYLNQTGELYVGTPTKSK